jgi:hypothetical protein
MSRLGPRTFRSQTANAGVASLASTKPIGVYAPVNPIWVRDPLWVANDSPNASQVFTAVAAVFDVPNNFVQFNVGTASVDVVWGDGTTSSGVTGTISKTYSFASVTSSVTSGGYKTARITVSVVGGSLTTLNFNVANASDASTTSSPLGTTQLLELKISAVSLTTLNLGSSSFASGKQPSMLQNLEIGVNSITSFASICASFARLEKVSLIVLNTCTSLQSAFSSCSNLIEATIFGSGQNVTTALSIFNNCSALQSVVISGIGNAGVPASFQSAFNNCRSLRFVSLGTSVIGNALSMFYGCRSLRRFPIMNTATITNANNMFAQTQLEIVPDLNMPACTNMFGMFDQCYHLKSVGTITTSSALTTIEIMFQVCTSLIAAPRITNVSSVTSAAFAFNGCHNLQFAPDFATNAAVSLNSMFYDCRALERAPAINCPNATNASSTFFNCSMLQTVPAIIITNATTTSSMFSGCSKLKTVPSITTSSALTTTATMFQNCSRLEDASALSTMTMTNVNSTSSMFNGCVSLTKLPSSLGGAALRTISAMFASCNSLVTAPTLTLGGFTAGQFLGSNAYTTTGSLNSVGNTAYPSSFAVANNRMTSAALNTLYTNLPSRIARSISGASGNGSTVTYTTSAAHGYIPGMVVTMTGISSTNYNLASVTIATVPNATQFTVQSTAQGPYSAGTGTVTPAAGTCSASGNPGYAGSTTSIATGKGWTVS